MNSITGAIFMLGGAVLIAGNQQTSDLGYIFLVAGVGYLIRKDGERPDESEKPEEPE